MTRLLFLLVPLIFISTIETRGDETLASRFSEEWKTLSKEVRDLNSILKTLPPIPAEDFAGSRPFLRVFSPESDGGNKRIQLVIRLRWPEDSAKGRFPYSGNPLLQFSGTKIFREIAWLPD